MGRTVCGQQGPVQRILLPSGYTRESGHTHKHGGDSQAVEHRTTPSILHLSRNRNITRSTYVVLAFATIYICADIDRGGFRHQNIHKSTFVALALATYN